jgi:hypothetical protein
MNAQIGLWRAFSKDLLWPLLHEQRRLSAILHIQHPAAVATYATFADYEDIAIALSKYAAYSLIWMIDGTPLKIEANHAKGYWTRADEEFFNHQCAGPKVRIVVFRNYKQLKSYIKARRYSETFDISKFTRGWWPIIGRRVNKKLLFESYRCSTFEVACTKGPNSGRLLFTTAHLLDRLTGYNSDALDIGVICPVRNETAYCFQSPFESSEFSRTRTKPEEVKFFPLKPNCHGVPGARHYEDFTSDVLYDRSGLTQWAFDTPEELKVKTKRMRWWLRRARRKSGRIWRDIMGTREASFMDKFHRVLLLTPAVIVIGLGAMEAAEWCFSLAKFAYGVARSF